MDDKNHLQPVAKMDFYSPINLDRSSGRTNLSEKAKSHFELYIHPDNTGFIEWTIEELDIVEHIGLWFQADHINCPKCKGTGHKHWKDKSTGNLVRAEGTCQRCEGRRTILKHTLTDYDGVFDIPTQALDLLESQGIDVTDMRQHSDEHRTEAEKAEAIAEIIRANSPDVVYCESCKGTGKYHRWTLDAQLERTEDDCNRCNGTGSLV